MPNAFSTPQQSPLPTSERDERRGAVRQSSGLLGTCRIVDAPQDQLWTCEIQDVSFTGLALVLRRWFGPGTALVVQPFGNPAQAPALVASVKRARPQGGGFWHHGCRFVKPLNEEELRALLPGQLRRPASADSAPAALEAGSPVQSLAPPRPPASEQRRHVRFSGSRTAICRLLGNEAKALRARIDNVSRTGLALRMRLQARRGSVLVMSVDGLGGRFARPMLARVTSCRVAGEGVWQMGCSFVRPLTDEEVQVLLVPNTRR